MYVFLSAFCYGLFLHCYYHQLSGVPVFMLKDIGIGFRTVEGATEVANLLVKYVEVAMNFIKEAYPFNEETESFIRKKFDMPMPDESKE